MTNCILKFGKYKGQNFESAPESYQNWLLKQDWFKLPIDNSNPSKEISKKIATTNRIKLNVGDIYRVNIDTESGIYTTKIYTILSIGDFVEYEIKNIREDGIRREGNTKIAIKTKEEIKSFIRTKWWVIYNNFPSN